MVYKIESPRFLPIFDVEELDKIIFLGGGACHQILVWGRIHTCEH